MKLLVDRYDTLIKKSDKTTEEHKDLEDIFKRLRSAFPSMITDWEDYNNILGLNTKALDGALKKQQELLELQLRSQIFKLSEEFEDLKTRISDNNQKLKEFEKSGINLFDIFKGLAGIDILGKDFEQQIVEDSIKMKELETVLARYVALSGDAALVTRLFGKEMGDAATKGAKELNDALARDVDTGKVIGPVVSPAAQTKLLKIQARIAEM